MGVEKAEEEEGEKMESFFCDVHEFLTDYTNFLGSPAVVSPVIPFVPVFFAPAALSLPSPLSFPCYGTTSRSSA